MTSFLSKAHCGELRGELSTSEDYFFITSIRFTISLIAKAIVAKINEGANIHAHGASPAPMYMSSN